MLNKLDLGVMHTVDPPEIPWVVEGLAARGALTVLVGDGGLGKSFLAVAVAQAVTQGEHVIGLRTKKGRVAIVDAENGPAEIHRRVRKLGLKDHAAVYEAQGFDLERDVAQLADLAWDRELVVLDSFSSMWSGDENDRLAVQAVLDPVRVIAREYDTAFLMLHHTAKAGNVFRGSGAIKNVPEIMVLMGSGYMGRRDKIAGRRWLRWEKCRMGAPPSRVWFEIVGGSVMSSRAPNPSEDLWPRDM